MNDCKLNLVTLARVFASEDEAREFLEAKRWPNGVFCPRCGEGDPYKLNLKHDENRPCRKGTFKCAGCRKRFTVRTGTVLEESRLPLTKWCMAFHLMTSSKKGISSRQLERELGVTPKTAWFLSMRIREAMRAESPNGDLSGTVEIDECYLGGKPRHANNPTNKEKKPAKRGRGTNKQPVMVLVERDGSSYSTPVNSVDAPTLKNVVRKHVDRSSTIMSDEWPSYMGLGKEFASHRVINHGQKEYVRYEDNGETLVSTNTAESWFALLKRAHYGIHHSMSKTHLHRYCTERTFMWNHRKVSDGERMVAAIEGSEGKRLYYRRTVEA